MTGLSPQELVWLLHRAEILDVPARTVLEDLEAGREPDELAHAVSVRTTLQRRKRRVE